MKSPKIHSILSEVYRLLGNYTAADFADASTYGNIPQPVRDALRALSREATADAQSERAKPRRQRPDTSAIRSRLFDDFSSLQGLANAIRHASRFNSTQTILQFAKEAGLSVAPRSKESRERLAKRVAEQISLTKEPRRSQIISRLAGEGDSQTQGWIDTIKTPRQ